MKKNKKKAKTELLSSNPMKEVFIISACALAWGISPFSLCAADLNQDSALPLSKPNSASEGQEIESLRQQLLQTTRELHDFKAKLFRSSHPKDEATIAELGKLLAEKEALNQQLSAALQNMDKEVIHARKQLLANETSNEVLCSYVETQRQTIQQKEEEHKEEMKRQEERLLSEKQELLGKMALYEREQEKLLANLKGEGQSREEWENAFRQQRALSRSLLTEIGDLSSLFHVLNQMHQEELSQQSAEHYTHLETAKLISDSIVEESHGQQEELKKQQEWLLQQSALEKAAANRLEQELVQLQQLLFSQIARAQKLERTETEALSFASDLTKSLIETENQHTFSEQQRLEALQQLEKTETALLNQQNALSTLRENFLHEQMNHLSALSDLETLYQQLDSTTAKLSEAKQYIAEKEERLSSAQEEFKQQESKWEGLQLQFEKKENEKQDLYSAALQELEQTRATLDAELTLLRNQLDEKEARLATIQSDLEKEKNARDEEKGQGQSHLQNLRSDLMQEKVDNLSLLTNMESLYLELGAAKSKLLEAKKLIEEKEKQLSSSQTALETKEADHLTLISQLDQKEKEHQNLYLNASLELEKLERARTSLQEELADLSRLLNAKEESLAAHQTNLEREQQARQLADMQAEQSKNAQKEWQAQIEDHQKKLAEYQEESQLFLPALQEKERSIQEHAQELKILLKHLEVLAQKNADFKERSDDLEADLIQLSSSLTEKEGQTAEDKDKMTAMEAEIEQLKHSLITTHEEHQQQVQALKSADDATIFHLTRQLNELALSMERGMGQQEEMERAIERLFSQATQQENSLTETVRKNRVLEAENDLLRQRLNASEQAERATKAKEALTLRSETADTEKKQPLLPEILLKPLLRD